MSQTQSPIASTTPEALRAAIANYVQIDAQQLRARVGNVLVSHSKEPQYQEAIARSFMQSKSMAIYDAGNGEREPATVFFADRIPAGCEQRVFLREMMQFHGRKADPDTWDLLRRHAESWDTWGGMEGRIYKKVQERLKREEWQLHRFPPRTETAFIFAVQEAVRQRVEPDPNGRGASGWLHTVFETVRESANSMLGVDLHGFTPQDFVSLLQVGSPFGPQMDAMDAYEISQKRKAQEAERIERQERDWDAKFEENLAKLEAAPTAAGTRMEELERRVAFLTAQLKEAKGAIEGLVEESRDGRWLTSTYLSDDVTSLVEGVMTPQSMNAALWEIKDMVMQEGTRDRNEAIFLQDLKSLVEAGLQSAVGTTAERDALKEILRIARPGAESGSASWDRDVSDEVMSDILKSLGKGLPHIVFVQEEKPARSIRSGEDGPSC